MGGSIAARGLTRPLVRIVMRKTAVSRSGGLVVWGPHSCSVRLIAASPGCKARMAMPQAVASADVPLWVASFGSSAGAISDDVIGALRAQGLNAGATPPSGAGVILFDEVSTGLSRLVHECSNGGLECVIAVNAVPTGLAEGALWRLLDAGASDVFVWDPSHGPATVAARLDRWQQVDDLTALPLVRDRLVGESRAWRSVLRRIVEVARFTDSPVLITGESGTGKELAARLIHALDARTQKRDLVVLDCTTIVPTLSGSEFFGHERGAFTGADSTRDGAFALADGGTLFLDEVGELPLALQAELLRVVQEGTYKRVGGNVWRASSFRLVCATNKDLLAEAAQERFRRDFYYRIAAWRIDLPRLGRSPRRRPAADPPLPPSAPARPSAVRSRRAGSRLPGPAGISRQCP